jgi:hypothetical protein
MTRIPDARRQHEQARPVVPVTLLDDSDLVLIQLGTQVPNPAAACALPACPCSTRLLIPLDRVPLHLQINVPLAECQSLAFW